MRFHANHIIQPNTLSRSERHLRLHLCKILMHYAYEFAEEHGVGERTALEWATKDCQGIELYCKYLAKHNILNCTPYSVTIETLETNPHGFDIKEDRLYTLQSLRNVEI